MANTEGAVRHIIEPRNRATRSTVGEHPSFRTPFCVRLAYMSASAGFTIENRSRVERCDLFQITPHRKHTQLEMTPRHPGRQPRQELSSWKAKAGKRVFRSRRSRIFNSASPEASTGLLVTQQGTSHGRDGNNNPAKSKQSSRAPFAFCPPHRLRRQIADRARVSTFNCNRGQKSSFGERRP